MPADSRETKRRVLAAATELFAERGFHGTTVRDIAQRAGVNLAAGHYHVGPKETLYLEVLRGQFGTVTAELEARGARPPARVGALGRAALIELLRVRIATLLESQLGPPPGLPGTLMQREMCDPSAALPDIVEQFILPHKREFERIVAALESGLGAEQVERCVFSMVGQVFFYRTHLPVLRYLLGPHEPTRKRVRAIAEHIAEFSLGGIARLAAQRRKRRRPCSIPSPPRRGRG